MKTKVYSSRFAPEFTVPVAAALLAIAVTLAQGAPPPAGGAVGAAGNLGGAVGLGNPGGLGTAGAAGFNGSARGAGGVGTQGNGAFSTGSSARSAFDDSESIGMRQERARAQTGATTTGNADAHASVMGQAHGLSVATLAAGGASASLNTAETVHAIQAQAMDSREDLLAELHTRVDASAKAMVGVRKSGAKLDGDAKADFKAASADVKAKEKALNKSMKAAEKADATTWVAARAKLSDDYDAYAGAVARAEAASQVEAKAQEKSKS